MLLGIIAKPTEISFIKAQEKGLDFLEFTINKGDSVPDFIADVGNLKKYAQDYQISIGSLGRWKTETIAKDGSPNKDELENAYKLIDACEQLGSPVYNCGCNYLEEYSYYENCIFAINFLEKLIAYGKERGVTIATYNCRKGTFIHNPVAWKIIHGYLKDLRIKFDPSHSIYAGDDYLTESQNWGHLFEHVHLKGSFLLNGKRVDDPPAGMDQTDWPLFLSILLAKGYKGGLSIEPHSDVWKDDRLDEGVEITIRYINGLGVRTLKHVAMSRL